MGGCSTPRRAEGHLGALDGVLKTGDAWVSMAIAELFEPVE